MKLATVNFPQTRLLVYLRVLNAQIAGLEVVVDSAYENGDPLADELDAQLAECRRRLDESEADWWDFEDQGEWEEPDYHEGVSVEEQLIAAYTHYLRNDPRGPLGSREDIVQHMRGVIEDGAKHAIVATDDEVAEAAHDAFATELARRRRRGRHQRRDC